MPNTDLSTTDKEPVVVLIGASLTMVNAALGLLFTFVSWTATQTAATFALANAWATWITVLVTRGKVVSVAALDAISGK